MLFSSRLFSILLLTLAVLLAGLPGLGGEFIYDDRIYITRNSEIRNINSLKDCLGFEMEPSRPASNFLIASAHLISRGGVLGMRIISLGLHGAVTILLYLNLFLFCKRQKIVLPTFFPSCVALLFAVLPVHFEVLLVAKFQSELWAALFTLASSFVFQLFSHGNVTRNQAAFRNFAGGSLLAAAILSKEVFLVIAPVFILSTYFSGSHESGKSSLFWTLSVVVGLCAAGILALQLPPQPVQPGFPGKSYVEHIGMDVLSTSEHLILAARALIEAIMKITTGRALTMVRLKYRFGPGNFLTPSASVFVLLLAVSTILASIRRRGWVAIWSLNFGVCLFIYLLIPNINIGSNRYLYLASACAMCLIVYLGWRCLLLFKLSQKAIGGLFIFYGLFLCSQLRTQLFSHRWTYSHYFTELNQHPEAPIYWAALMENMMEKTGNIDHIWLYILVARRVFPHLTYFAIAELEYYLRKEEFSQARKTLYTIKEMNISKENYRQLLVRFQHAQNRTGSGGAISRN